MSVHSTHYDESEEYERDLKWEYRRAWKRLRVRYATAIASGHCSGMRKHRAVSCQNRTYALTVR